MPLTLQLPKITSEQQYRKYKSIRQNYIDLGTAKAYAAEINELNLRIIQWNCRNDEHNPVQTIDQPDAVNPFAAMENEPVTVDKGAYMRIYMREYRNNKNKS
jgi:hypothetical protein